jgi:hypothetical protein
MDSITSFIYNLIKIVLVLAVLAVLAGVFCTSAVFLTKESISSKENDACAPLIDGKNNPFYRQEWYICWKNCSPKTPRLNPKTCECTCINELSI